MRLWYAPGERCEIETRPILVVDDDSDLREMLSRLLHHRGYLVDAEPSATSALAYCAREMPALIVLDLMLPHMDGEEFLQRYYQRWGETTAPVILLSASAMREEVAARCRVAGSIGKPFAMDELIELVDDVMRRTGNPPLG